MAEVGDASRFPGEGALARFIGLTWGRRQSGGFEAEHRPLSRTGDAYLRSYLVEGANAVSTHCREFGSFHRRKFHEATQHHHRRALSLTTRKLVRLVHSLLQGGQLYRPPRAPAPR